MTLFLKERVKTIKMKHIKKVWGPKLNNINEKVLVGYAYIQSFRSVVQ